MELQWRPRRATVHEIPDPRPARGWRHPLPAMLARMCVAMWCGDRSDRAMAEWGRDDDPKLARVRGFTPDQTPCAATVHHVQRQLDSSLVEAALGAWAERVLTALPPAAGAPEALALDGTT
jgi:DDE family transposase